jgi:hypothetical protein
MNNVATVNFTTQPIDNPANIVPGGWFVWLTKDNRTVGAETLPVEGGTAAFAVTEVGTYVARVVRLTSTGDSIGSAVESEPVVVTPAKIAVPATVTLVITGGQL